MFEQLTYEAKDGIGYIVINRPSSRNSLCNALVEELDEAIKAIEADESVRALILTGTGDKAFMAGADIGELKDRDFIIGRKQTKRRQEVYNRIADMPIPTIAAVNGFALGAGLELALACTIRICVPDAKFGAPEVNLGIIPGDGATQRLPRTIGLGRAMYMVLTAEMINAEQALSFGLVTKIVPKEELREHAEGIAKTIMSKPPLAIQYAKDALNRAFDTSLPVGLFMESYLHALACATEDKREGVEAFLQKRTPKFTGK